MLPNISDPQVDFGLPKTDRDTKGPVDPNKELRASEFEAVAVDVAAATHVMPRAWVYVTWSGAAYSITDYDSVWGSDVASRPSVTMLGAGNVRLTWNAAGYPDLNPTPARRVTRAPNIRCISVEKNQASFVDKAWTTNTVTVQMYDETYAAVDGDFVVWIY